MSMTNSDEFPQAFRHMQWLVPVFLISGMISTLMLLYILGIGGRSMLVFAIFAAIGWGLAISAFAIATYLHDNLRRRAIANIHREIEVNSDPAWGCDHDGQIVFQNAASLEGFGDIIGRNINLLIDLYRADSEGARRTWLADATKNGYAEVGLSDETFMAIKRSGRTGLYLWMILRGNNRTEQEMAAPPVLTDLKDFEVVPAALLRLSADGNLLFANAAARHLLSGIAADDSCSTTKLEDIFDRPDQHGENWLEEFMAGQPDSRTEILRLRKSLDAEGETADRYVQIVLSSAASGPPGFIAALTDASELKTLEAQFVQSQKMQAIGQLAGGIAHDFNNLLTAIRGHCDLLMLRHDNADPDYADLDQISQNTNRAAALVGQLLSFSRKQTLKLEMLDLRDILADLTHLLNRLVGERTALQISHQPSLKGICADRRLLEQVIMNLVVNARDAMPDGGEIRLATENRTLEEAMIGHGNTLPAGDYVCITVSDTGCGILRENIDKIFDPFFTTKPVGEGTGLGLSTVYGIVSQTGGYILCDSEPGQGTCFTIYLPAQVGEFAVQPILPEATVPAFLDRSATILLVEDEASVRAVASRALRLRGYEVHEADCGEEALALLGDDALRPDIFVTDVVMPGMDGPCWVAKALQQRPETRVVFMSGYSEDVFIDGKLPVPHSVFLAKPFSLAELVEVVQQQIADMAPRG